MKVEAEAGVMQLQAKEHQHFGETTSSPGGARKGFPAASQGTWPLHSGGGLAASRKTRQDIYVILSHPVYSTLL